MTTRKGETEIDGVKFGYHAENVQYNKRPSSLFAGMQISDERGYVILMGEASDVMRFGLKVKDRGGTTLIGLLRRGEDWAGGDHFAACVLGEWPCARLQEVVGRFAALIDGGPGVWARIFMDEIRADPDRLETKGPDEDNMRFFAKLYDDQCRLCAL